MVPDVESLDLHTDIRDGNLFIYCCFQVGGSVAVGLTFVAQKGKGARAEHVGIKCFQATSPLLPPN
jgi:hypothetical protein